MPADQRGTLLVEHDRGRLGLRVVAADRLDDAAVARGPAVGDHHAPHRVLLPADAGETKTNCHERPKG